MIDRTTGEDDRLTIAGIGALSFISAMLLHEALGHAGVNAILGEKSIIYPLWTQSVSSSAWMVAAGPAMNFAAGLALSLLLRLFRGMPVHWRYFFWLSAAFNLFNASGYLLLGAVSGFGDWGFLFGAWRVGTLSRGVLALLAGVLYYTFMFVISFVANFRIDQPRFRRLVLLPYFSAGVTACSAAAVSMQGWAVVVLAAAASFGAGIGLLLVTDWKPLADKLELKPISRNPKWVYATAVAVFTYIVVVGRGVPV